MDEPWILTCRLPFKGHYPTVWHCVLPKKCRYLKRCINLYVYSFSMHGDMEELGRIMSCFLYFLLWTNSEILQCGLKVCIWNFSDFPLYPQTPCSLAANSLGQLWGIEMLSVCDSRWFLKKHLCNLHCSRVWCQKTPESGFYWGQWKSRHKNTCLISGR